MFKKLKKAYISIEVVILASIIIIGGICALSAFLKNGQNAQSQSAEAINNTIDMIGEDFEFSIGGGNLPGGGEFPGGGGMPEESEWYIQGTTSWVYKANVGLVSGTEEAVTNDTLLLADNIAYPDESETGHAVAALGMISWLAGGDTTSPNGLQSPQCTGPYKYIYRDDRMVGFYSNNCLKADEAMIYFDKDKAAGEMGVGVYNEHFEIRDNLPNQDGGLINGYNFYLNQKYSGYNSNSSHSFLPVGEFYFIFKEDGTASLYTVNEWGEEILIQSTTYTYNGTNLNVTGFGSATPIDNGDSLSVPSFGVTLILGNATYTANSIEYVYWPDYQAWYVNAFWSGAITGQKITILSEIRGYPVLDMTSGGDEAFREWINSGNAQAIIYNGVEYTDLYEFFEVWQEYANSFN